MMGETKRNDAACKCSCHDPAGWGEYVVHMAGGCCNRTDITGYVPKEQDG